MARRARGPRLAASFALVYLINAEWLGARRPDRTQYAARLQSKTDSIYGGSTTLLVKHTGDTRDLGQGPREPRRL